LGYVKATARRLATGGFTKDAAEETLLRIISRGESLEGFPHRGRTPPELRAIGDQTWRKIQEPPWRILYRIADKKTVEIHGVFDGRRSLEDILMERLLQA
jgi:plasmid stabilization system protein ParE